MARRVPREVRVHIDTLNDQGLGEGEVEARTVVARNALPGEEVNVRVLKRRAGVWRGEAQTPERPSAWRRTPACDAYPRCGGCSLQHVDYAVQLAHKEQRLRAALDAAGVQPMRFRVPVSGPQFHYRYKARLGVRAVGGGVLAGFREGFSSRVARMDDCKTLALPFARMLPALKDTIARLSEPGRIPQVELAAGDCEFAVVVRHLTPLEPGDEALLGDFGRRTGMRVYLQPGGYETVAPLVAEPTYLSYTNPEFGLCFQFLPMDFTQVNPWINRALVRSAALALAPRRGAVVVDLFCGIGNFSLALARQGVRVLGLEASEGAVARARHNAALNGLSRWAEFAPADLYDARCPELPAAEYLLLDPPRSGAGPNLSRWIGDPRLERIVYVSCNPRTFASDAAILREGGFELEEAGMFDMFPHTAHVEALGLFRRRMSDVRVPAVSGRG